MGQDRTKKRTSTKNMAEATGHRTNTSVRVRCPGLDELDRVVVTLERLWGPNVLPLLATKETRQRFEEQRERLNRAIDRGVAEEIEKQARGTMKGWKVIEREARDRGNHPTGKVWVGWHSEGAAVCVFAHGATITDLPEGVLSFSVDELVALIPPEVIRIKANFEGATVKTTRKVEETKEDVPFDDPIPF